MNGKSGQLDRFKDAARQLGADESDDALDKVMGRLDLKQPPDEADKGKANKKTPDR